jgi:2-deoxy-D-gluconate 3-dehydrogenase
MTSRLFDLTGRVALIVGASRGIGRAIAEGFAAAGADIALASRTENDLRQVAAAIREEGRRAESFVADISRVVDAQKLVHDVLDRMGQVDILVNVAGINRRKPALEITEEDWDAVFDLNLKGMFFTAQAVGRYWLDSRRFAAEQGRGCGKIINIGSIAGHRGFRRRAPYTSSKSGVSGLTRTLALEWAADGVCVNCLAPGYVETDLTKPLFDDPAFLETLRGRIAMGRRGYPKDMIGPAIFLASPASDYMTGQTLVVDGGYLAG